MSKEKTEDIEKGKELDDKETSFFDLSWEVEKAKNQINEDIKELKQIKEDTFSSEGNVNGLGKGDKGSIVIGKGTLGKGTLKGTLTKDGLGKGDKGSIVTGRGTLGKGTLKGTLTKMTENNSNEASTSK